MKLFNFGEKLTPSGKLFYKVAERGIFNVWLCPLVAIDYNHNSVYIGHFISVELNSNQKVVTTFEGDVIRLFTDFKFEIFRENCAICFAGANLIGGEIKLTSSFINSEVKTHNIINQVNHEVVYNGLRFCKIPTSPVILERFLRDILTKVYNTNINTIPISLSNMDNLSDWEQKGHTIN
jgi:hypothetical protein